MSTSPCVQAPDNCPTRTEEAANRFRVRGSEATVPGFDQALKQNMVTPAFEASNYVRPPDVGEQLDAAAAYFFAVWRLGDSDDPGPEDWVRVAEACAYSFVANADAWRRFCRELGIT